VYRGKETADAVDHYNPPATAGGIDKVHTLNYEQLYLVELDCLELMLSQESDGAPTALQIIKRT
jgi:hypothetical protein